MIHNMNGLDCLREELKRRGFKENQISSGIVREVLDILSGADGKYLELENLYEDIDKAKHDLALVKAETDLLKDTNKDLEALNESMKRLKLETTGCRDVLKLAQWFIDHTSVDTPQNNTAYIKGLADILSSTSKQGVNTDNA